MLALARIKFPAPFYPDLRRFSFPQHTHTHTWGKINKKKKENLGFIGRILTYSLGALIINVLGFFFASYK